MIDEAVRRVIRSGTVWGSALVVASNLYNYRISLYPKSVELVRAEFRRLAE